MAESGAHLQSRFLDDYEVLPFEIEKGSFGTPYKVRRRFGTDEVTFIKLLDGYYQGDFSYACSRNKFLTLEYSLREDTVLRSLQHPNIVRILNSWLEEVHPSHFRGRKGSDALFCSGGVLFIEMEWCDRGTLSRWLNSPWRSEIDGWRIIWQISNALVYLHSKSKVHRDLKPANILFLSQGEKIVTKMGDFGLATEVRTRMTSRVGTRGYRAPELNKAGGTSYTEKVDIYSLGVMLFQILIYAKKAIDLEKEFYASIIAKDKGITGKEPAQPRWELRQEEIELILRMVQNYPAVRPTATSTVADIERIIGDSARMDISLFDEAPHVFRFENNEGNNVLFSLPPSEKLCGITNFVLLNVPIQLNILLPTLAQCSQLISLELEISIEENMHGYWTVPLPKLRRFRLSHQSQTHDDYSFTDEVPESVLQAFLFFASTEHLLSQIQTNDMSIQVKLRGVDLLRLEMQEGLFSSSCASNFLLPLIPQSNNAMRQISLHNTNCSQDTFEGDTHLHLDELELINTNLNFSIDLCMFRCLSRVLLVGDLECFPHFDLPHLPGSVEFVSLTNFRITINSGNKDPISLLQLSLLNCILPENLASIYAESFEVEELTLVQNESSCVLDFDFLLEVMQTAWRVIRFLPFVWSVSSENQEAANALKTEDFMRNDFQEGTPSIEVTNGVNSIQTVAEYNYRSVVDVVREMERFV